MSDRQEDCLINKTKFSKIAKLSSIVVSNQRIIKQMIYFEYVIIGSILQVYLDIVTKYSFKTV